MYPHFWIIFFIIEQRFSETGAKETVVTLMLISLEYMLTLFCWVYQLGRKENLPCPDPSQTIHHFSNIT